MMVYRRVVVICLLVCLAAFSISAQLLESEKFASPPQDARPRTWMHVMSGNMSTEGLTKDLEAMEDAGIGGIILFNVTHMIPEGPMVFNSEEHIAMTAHAAAECERLGLSFGVHNCDGWTSSGGPWVSAEHAMKEVVYSETIVEGGDVDVNLAMPSQRGGFAQDIAVIAYPALASELADAANIPVVSSSQENLNLSIINDTKIDEYTELIGSEESPASLVFSYAQPYELRSIYLNCNKAISNKGAIRLLSSQDGLNYKEEKVLKLLRLGKRENGLDAHFDAIKARFFKIEMTYTLDISELNLSSTYRYNDMIGRTSRYMLENHRLPRLDDAPATMLVRKDAIIDLTSAMDKEGHLVSALPEGKWTIMRFAYTITGAVNSPASDAGRGWEVDKMSRESFKVFFDGYVGNVINASKAVAPNALQYMEIDSYEVGGQNWTKAYEKQFKAQHDYDILAYLPLYAGRYVEDTETTDKVLWDVRNFNSKMMTDNYFDYFTELCHNNDLISYVEPYSFNAAFNEIDATRKVDIPMGEFWMHQRYKTQTAVSGARIYGKNIVSAEAFSAHPEVNWKGHPGTLKLTGDRAWTLGINEFMFHRFAHQANTHVKPGMTMSQWGSHIDRTQTWWDNAGKSWFRYIARGQYMLRQGIPVSQLLVFVGDGSPNSSLERYHIKPELPNHINYDCVNMDALLHRISAKDKKMVLPNGLEYSALYLSNTKEIRLTTLRKIAELSEQGVLIIGKQPGQLGGYTYTAADEAEFKLLVDKIWSQSTTYTSGDWDVLFEKHEIPVDLKIKQGEAVTYIHRQTKVEDIYFFFNPDTVARHYECTFNVDGKIPELWNQMTGEITKLAVFEHENAQTKVLVSLPAEGSSFVVFRESSEGVPSVPLSVREGNDKVTCTLNDANALACEISDNGLYELTLNDGTEQSIKAKNIPEDVLVDGDWTVTFPDVKVDEKKYTFPELMDWTTHPTEGIKHYSGTAIYQTSFTLSKKALAKAYKISLDLGQVEVAARVVVNGQDLGVLWKAPYVVDLTNALVVGDNSLQIEVTNQWTNRLIGDEYFPNESGYNRDQKMPEWYINNEPAPITQRSTFTTFAFYKKGDELLPAGLLGPVKLKTTLLVEK